MSDEKFNFDDIGKDAAYNEPHRSFEGQGAQSDNENLHIGVAEPLNGSETDEETVKFEFHAEFLTEAIVEGFAVFWRSIWGKGEGAELTTKEKEGFSSLFERGARHFGFVSYISGGKGFFIELLGRLLAALIPRFANDDLREHVFKTSDNNQYKDDKKNEPIYEHNEQRNEQPEQSNNGLTKSNFAAIARSE